MATETVAPREFRWRSWEFRFFLLWVNERCIHASRYPNDSMHERLKDRKERKHIRTRSIVKCVMCWHIWMHSIWWFACCFDSNMTCNCCLTFFLRPPISCRCQLKTISIFKSWPLSLLSCPSLCVHKCN